MGIRLFEHNQAAYDAAVSMLSESGKAAVIHPTGTGKSFIGFKLCEDNPDKAVCWLSPSAYIFQTQLENLKKLPMAMSQRTFVFLLTQSSWECPKRSSQQSSRTLLFLTSSTATAQKCGAPASRRSYPPILTFLFWAFPPQQSGIWTISGTWPMSCLTGM